MNKAQALDFFWNSFDLLAYDENTVPQGAELPYITYSVSTDSLDNTLSLYASIWYKSTSWREITLKTEEIEKRLGEHGGEVIPLDEGYLWIKKGVPFAQRVSDPDDDTIRRMYINVSVEFLTAY